jgi:hypothetical protein
MKQFALLLLTAVASAQQVDFNTEVKGQPFVSVTAAPWFVNNKGTADASAALDAALKAAAAAGLNEVILPPGTYLLGSRVTLPDGMKIACANGSSINNPAVLFKANANNFDMFRNVFNNRSNGIYGCAFRGNGHTGVTFIYLDGCVSCEIENNTFANFDATSTAIKGGADLYTDIGKNIMLGGYGFGLDFQESYGSMTTYYGLNVGKIHDNILGSGMGSRCGCAGPLEWNNNDVEMAINTGAGGMEVGGTAIHFGDPHGIVDVNMTGANYFELSPKTANPCYAIVAQPESRLMIDGAEIYGGSSSSPCTAIALVSPAGVSGATTSFTVRNVHFLRWKTGINFAGVTGTGSPDSAVESNFWSDVTTRIVYAGSPLQSGLINLQSQNSNAHHTEGVVKLTDPDFGFIVGGAHIVKTIVRVSSPANEIDLSRGDLFELCYDGKSTTYSGLMAGTYLHGDGIFSIVNRDCPGATLSNAGFNLAAGYDVTLPLFSALSFFIDETGKVHELGQDSTKIPTMAANLPACNAFMNGKTIPVTDSKVTAFGAPLTASSGGGTTAVIALCRWSGSSGTWTAH